MVLYKGERGCRPGREPVVGEYKVAVIWITKVFNATASKHKSLGLYYGFGPIVYICLPILIFCVMIGMTHDFDYKYMLAYDILDNS